MCIAIAAASMGRTGIHGVWSRSCNHHPHMPTHRHTYTLWHTYILPDNLARMFLFLREGIHEQTRNHGWTWSDARVSARTYWSAKGKQAQEEFHSCTCPSRGVSLFFVHLPRWMCCAPSIVLQSVSLPLCYELIRKVCVSVCVRCVLMYACWELLPV